MIRNFEIKIAERNYILIFEHDSPTEHVKEVCYQILKYVGQVEDAAKTAMEKEKSEQEESKVEDTSTE